MIIIMMECLPKLNKTYQDYFASASWNDSAASALTNSLQLAIAANKTKIKVIMGDSTLE